MRSSQLFLILPFLLGGCADLTPLQQNFSSLQASMGQLGSQPYALQCAPEAYALAQAHTEFALIEFREGDPRRAAHHVAIARKAAEEALVKAEACREKDTDKDGIPDDKDNCPNDAEDFDNDRDDDGCPEEAIVVKTTPTDRDGDGIPDAEDQCPDAPEDLDNFKDADGCAELDNDNDGVLDNNDKCPLNAEDYDQFEDADGCPDPDNDQDGILDTMDKCPNEPEDIDGDQDADGCPDLDKDGDGVPDTKDACPTEPEVLNGYADEDGCPDTKPTKVEVTKEQIVIKEQVQFQTGKAVILPASYPLLDDVRLVLKDFPYLKVRIEGHTDNQGADAANLKLSKARADAVFEYLLAKGVEARRMETVGFGEQRPIDTNLTPQGRQNNRRVEFHRIDNQAERIPEQPK